MNKKIWITGASGYIGHQLVNKFETRCDTDVLAIGGKSALLPVSGDLHDPSFVFFLLSTYGCPDVVVHCAGNKAVQRLEEHPDTAIIDNCKLTSVLFKVLPPSTHFIYLSSDHVFSGRKGRYDEKSCPDPATVYGYTKYLSERYLRRFPNVAIVRTAAVFDKDAAFPKMLLEKWQAGLAVSCFSDVFYSPIYLPCFIDGLERIINQRAIGIFHLTGPRISRYEFALVMAKNLGISTDFVQPERRYAGAESQDLSLVSEMTWSRLGLSCPSLDDCILSMLVRI